MGLRYEMDDTKLYHYQDFIDLVYDLAKEEETKSVVIATKIKCVIFIKNNEDARRRKFRRIRKYQQNG